MFSFTLLQLSTVCYWVMFMFSWRLTRFSPTLSHETVDCVLVLDARCFSENPLHYLRFLVPRRVTRSGACQAPFLISWCRESFTNSTFYMRGRPGGLYLYFCWSLDTIRSDHNHLNNHCSTVSWGSPYDLSCCRLYMYGCKLYNFSGGQDVEWISAFSALHSPTPRTGSLTFLRPPTHHPPVMRSVIRLPFWQEILPVSLAKIFKWLLGVVWLALCRWRGGRYDW